MKERLWQINKCMKELAYLRRCRERGRKSAEHILYQELMWLEELHYWIHEWKGATGAKK